MDDPTPLYQDVDAPVAARVDDLLPRLTLEEKVHQLASFFPNANVRLGIPHMQQGECLHGAMADGATSFPQALTFWKDGGWIVEPGEFTVMVGPNSMEFRTAHLEVTPEAVEHFGPRREA